MPCRVAEETKDKLLGANQVAERKGKALVAVFTQLTDDLSSSKRGRLAVESERDGFECKT